MQRLARAGEGAHGFGLQAFLLGEDLVHLGLEAHQVAAAAGNDIDHGLARGVGGAEGILVGVDVDALVGIGEVRPHPLGHGEMRLGEDGHGGQRGGARGIAEEGTTRKT